jgi:uncharacterized protein
MKTFHVVALVAAGLAVAALSGVARPEPAQSQSDEPRRVTVSGVGSVDSVPDVVSFSFGVETNGAGADDALEANARQMRRVIEALRAAGVSVKDIRTESVSLMPRLDDEGRTIAGYTARNSVRAEVDELARAGGVVDAAVDAGANEVYGLTLAREDQDALYRKALGSALEDARTKAVALADAGGASIGRVLTIVESGSAEPPIAYQSAALAARSAETPIEPGTEQIQARVTVTFALR